MLMSPHLMLRTKSLFDVRLSLYFWLWLWWQLISPPLFFSFLALNAALRRNTRTAAGLNTVVVFFFSFLTSDNTLEAVVTAPRFIAVQLHATQLFFKAWPASPNTSASVWIQYSRSHGSYTRPCCVCHCFARQLFCCSILHLWHTEYMKNNHSVCKT